MNENMLEQELEHKKYQKPHRRTRLEICLDILSTINKGVKKPTRIMYAVNMSWSPLQKILKSLVSTEFINEIEMKEDRRTTRHYEITQKGTNILNYLNRGTDFLRLMEITHLN